MNSYSVWLNVLTMLRRGRREALAALCCWLLAAAGAQAANVNFNGSNTVPVCPLSGTTYTCAALPLGANDTAVISSGYTVIINTDVALAYAQGLSMSGSAVLQVKGNLDLSASNGLNVSGGTLASSGNFKLGASAQSITANVTAATLTTAGASTYIGGTVTTTGDINLGSNTTITGAVTTTGSGSITTGSATTLGALSIKGSVNLSSSNTINGSVSAASITTNSSVTINGAITLPKNSSSAVADLGSGIKVSGSITAYSVQTNSPATLNGDISATTSLTLGSGSAVTGNITAPVVTLNASNSTVKGDITATTSLDMGSGTAVTGKVGTGTLTMRASNAVINGNAIVTGDVDMGSGTSINGDLSARNVVTRASNAVINGNAAVNAIYIDWGDSVTKTITCTGPGAKNCSCVTKADPNYQPTCGAAGPSGPDHIQITHDGKGLTCEPATVKLRACGNSDCSVAYTGSTTITLTPGGGQVTFTGDANATVAQSSAGTATLSAGTGTQCVNTSGGKPCEMVFSANGLTMSAPDHVSMTNATLLIQIKKAAPSNAFCVPLAQGSAKLNFSCAYSDPATGTQPLVLGNGQLATACNGNKTAVDVSFDANGLASVPLQYADVGLMNVAAAYSANGVDVAGSTSFTAAPAKFQIVAATDPAVTLGGVSIDGSAVAFARSADPFRLTVTALNAANKTTPNFGKEKAGESFTMSPIVLKLPSNGKNPTATTGTFANIVDGAGASTPGSAGLWVFSETGVITLNAKLSNSSSYYMGKTSLTSFRTTGTLDLRFAPHHFDVVLLAGAPMSCANVGGYSNPCAADPTNSSLIYSKQPFAVQVKAYKDASNASENYRLKTVSTDAEDVVRPITLSPAQAANGGASTSFKPLSASTFVFAAAPYAGIGSLTSAQPALEFTAPQAPPVTPSTTVTTSPPTTIYLRATDSDGASSARAGSAEPPLTVVSGRLTLSNAFGPQGTNLPVEAKSMYYSAAAKAWLLNPAFPSQQQAFSVPVAKTDGDFKTCTGTLDCSALRLVENPLTLKNGKGYLTVLAPKATGTAKLGLQPSLQALFPYLPMYDTGNLTFGTARSGPVIYTREVYN